VADNAVTVSSWAAASKSAVGRSVSKSVSARVVGCVLTPTSGRPNHTNPAFAVDVPPTPNEGLYYTSGQLGVVTQIEVSLSDQTESELRRLVEQGEFINRDQAVEKLLSRGLSAYQTTEEEPVTEVDENMFGQMTDEQQDPALQDEGTGDDYTF
jgi:hypothetical protein